MHDPVFTSLYEELELVVGPEAALRLCQELGGTKIWISRDSNRGTEKELCDLLGSETAEKLIKHFCHYDAENKSWSSSGPLTIPLGPTGRANAGRRLAIEALHRGASVREAVRESGLHERTIYRMIKRRRAQKLADIAAAVAKRKKGQ